MPYPYNPAGYDPMFQANMPNDYSNPTNFGGYGAPMGGWNVNSAYMTPSYLAPYRPTYSGNPNFQMPMMGFGAAASKAIPNPFAPPTPYYVSPLMYSQRASSEFVNKVGDAGMAGAQYLSSAVVGLAAYAAMDSLRFQGLGGSQQDIRAASHWWRSNMPTWAGGAGSASEAAYLSRSQTLFEAGGRAIGGGAGRAIGGAMTAAAQSASMLFRGRGISGLPSFANGLGRVGAFGGAVAGSLFLPYMAAEGIGSMFDQTVFTPYISGRQTADMIQDSMRGTYTGLGTAGSPLDVSASNATRMGFDLSRIANANPQFGMRSASDIFAGASAAGLFKGTGFNNGDIQRRFKEVTQSVSLMMSVFNDPSTQDAIARLGELSHAGGLNKLTALSGLGMRYRTASAITGLGTRELMAGVGSQGQMMFAQSGLTPYLGQLAAVNAMSGISAAYRGGLISSPSLAMMGGAEGATQLAVQAQIGLARNPYSEMVAFNQYVLGKGPGSMVNNIATFGNFMAGNPLSAYGSFMMNKDVALSSMIRDNPGQLIRNVVEHMRNMPGGINKNGKVDAMAAASIMMSMGMTPDQIRALYGQMQGEASAMKGGAYSAAYQESLASALNNTGLTYYSDSNWNPSKHMYNLRMFGKKLRDSASINLVQPYADSMASFVDWMTGINYGLTNLSGLENAAIMNTMSPTMSPADLDREMTFTTGTGSYNYANINRLLKSRPRAEGLFEAGASGVMMAAGSKLYTAGSAIPLKPAWPYLLAKGGLMGAGLLATGLGGYHAVAGVSKYMNYNSSVPKHLRGSISAIRALGDARIGNLDPNKLASNDLVYDLVQKTGFTPEDIRASLVYIANESSSTTKISLFNKYLQDMDDTMSRVSATMGTSHGNVNKLTRDEKLTLLKFGRKYRAKLSDVVGFAKAVMDEPVIADILSKAGYSNILSGSSDADVRGAMDFVRTVGGTTTGQIDPMIMALETAAYITGGKGQIKLITADQVKRNLPAANEAVRRVNTKGKVPSSLVKMSKDSPDQILSLAAGSDASIDAGLYSMGSQADVFDMSGLMQASTGLQSAAEELKKAAEYLQGKGIVTSAPLSQNGSEGNWFSNFMTQPRPRHEPK